ncbi:hypothetical protein Tco_0562551 [Tanacetum coccineum]
MPVYEQGPWPHYSSDCQNRNPDFYESNSYNNFDSSCFDQPPQYPIVHPPLHEISLHELSIMMNLGTPNPEPLVNSFVYKESDDDIEVTPAYTPPLPFLTTMEPADTLLMGDEVISTTLARETDKFIKSSIDDLVPIPKDFEVPSDSNLIPHSNFLVDKKEEPEPETITEVVEIASSQSTPLVPPPETPPLSAPKPKEDPTPNQPSIPYPSWFQNDEFQALKNPTGHADHFVYRIDIVDSFDSLVEETDALLSHFNDSSLDYETFFFDFEEKSSGSTTSHSNNYLLEYESFCFDVDHIKEKSSGSTTTHSDLSLLEYESFHFDLLIDPFPSVDRSDFYHEEFADELAHIISSPEYDYFYFDLEDDQVDLTRLFKENIFEDSTKELTSPELNDFSLLLPDYDSTFSEEFSEIDPLVSFPSENKDKIFDPGIFIIKGVQSRRFHILLLDDFSTTSFVSDSLLLTDPSEIETFLSFPSGNEDKVFDPGILIMEGIFSFTRKSPHLLINNFMIDKCHILSEISLMTESSVNFLPKDN